MLTALRSTFRPKPLMLACALASSSAMAADQPPSILDFLTFERLTQSLVQTGIIGIRSQMEISYKHISADPVSGQVAISGLEFYPEFPWLDLENGEWCRMTAQRALISSNGLASWDSMSGRIDLTGVVGDANCVPPEGRAMLQGMGIPVRLDRVYLDMDYKMSSAALSTQLHATINDIAMVNLNLDFSYFSFMGEDPEDMYPLARVERGSLVIENQGLWQKLKPMLPPPVLDPKMAGDGAAMMLSQGIEDINEAVEPDENGNYAKLPLNDAQKAFVESAKTQVSAFVENPRQLVLELNPEELASLDEYLFEDVPFAFEELRPLMVAGTSERRSVLDSELLRSALENPEQLSPEQRLAVGQALVSGSGAPRSVAMARNLLEPMAGSTPAAAQLLAQALADSEPTLAYRYALQSAQAEVEGSQAQVDQLERLLSTAQVLDIQQSMLKDGEISEAIKSLPALRNLAFAHLSGVGASRSYARAYLLASLAAAAGDGASQGIISEIDLRMSTRGEAVAKLWNQQRQELSEQAMSLWLDNNLAKNLAP